VPSVWTPALTTLPAVAVVAVVDSEETVVAVEVASEEAVAVASVETVVDVEDVADSEEEAVADSVASVAVEAVAVSEDVVDVAEAVASEAVEDSEEDVVEAVLVESAPPSTSKCFSPLLSPIYSLQFPFLIPYFPVPFLILDNDHSNMIPSHPPIFSNVRNSGTGGVEVFCGPHLVLSHFIFYIFSVVRTNL